jgi:thiol:disulfide interchange protein DsbD
MFRSYRLRIGQIFLCMLLSMVGWSLVQAQSALLQPDDTYEQPQGSLLQPSAPLVQPTLDAAPQQVFLAPEKAFQVSASMTDPRNVEIVVTIAPGYYIYRTSLSFLSKEASFDAPVMPAGKIKFDPNFNKELEIYDDKLTIQLPLSAQSPDQAFNLDMALQGCADQGLCYPLMHLSMALNPAKLDQVVKGVSVDLLHDPETDMGMIAQALLSNDLLVIIPLFVLLGLGLAFTPCVLPMVPILSAIIVGDQATPTKRRAFGLSLAYALGMACVYTLLGVAAGLMGEGLSAALQQPWVLSIFALVMVVLALPMFDVYQFQMPEKIQTSLARVSGHVGGGKTLGVFFMGMLSALIVGPCVAAPLAGILVYISQTRDALLGGVALFALAAGMSVPLLCIGASAGTLLPKAGAWMTTIKHFFGVLMLATAWWMMQSVLPVWVMMAGWAVLGIGYGCWLLFGTSSAWWAKAVGIIVLLLGAVQLVGVASGGRDVLRPFAHLQGSAQAPTHVQFTRIQSEAALEAALKAHAGQLVMLDFYADWCVSCIEMERYTFPDPQVKAKLDQMVLLQIDVTANNANDRAMLRRFGLFGPPGIMFFNRQGQEMPQRRVIGFQDANRFLQSLNALE